MSACFPAAYIFPIREVGGKVQDSKEAAYKKMSLGAPAGLTLIHVLSVSPSLLRSSLQSHPILNRNSQASALWDPTPGTGQYAAFG